MAATHTGNGLLFHYVVHTLFYAALMLSNVALTQNTYSRVEGPPLPNRPFIVVWNTPTNRCESHWHIALNLSAFDFVVNRDQGWHGEYITIFYSEQLGLYPFFDNKKAINGGLPQLGNLSEHYKKVKEGINSVIPDPDFQGVGIIDWEAWRPVFDRNWDTLSIYREKSIELVKDAHPSWPQSLVEETAKLQFENGARKFMEGTILLAQQLRPRSFWGFYGFPNCYNDKDPPYTCSNLTMKQNDQISWLFESSSAIFPSIYLHPKPHLNTTLFVKYQLQEAFRKARKYDGILASVYPYVRITYAISQIYLTEGDVMATIAQSAESGTAGVVIWGDHLSDNSRTSCLEIQTYIDKFLGPLVRNLTEITQRCSTEFCNMHGRCTFKLNPAVYVKPLGWGLVQDLTDKWAFLKCNCYRGWHGKGCSEEISLSTQ